MVKLIQESEGKLWEKSPWKRFGGFGSSVKRKLLQMSEMSVTWPLSSVSGCLAIRCQAICQALLYWTEWDCGSAASLLEELRPWWADSPVIKLLHLTAVSHSCEINIWVQKLNWKQNKRKQRKNMCVCVCKDNCWTSKWQRFCAGIKEVNCINWQEAKWRKVCCHKMGTFVCCGICSILRLFFFCLFLDCSTQ